MKLQYAVVEILSLLEGDSVAPANKKRRLGNVLKEQKKIFVIVASDLVPTLEAKWGTKLVVKKTLAGSDLENCRFEFLIETCMHAWNSLGTSPLPWFHYLSF